jgi:CheY-like chemotaxis protein
MQKAVSARDEFLATISHELRTPLNAILGWTQMLRTGALDEETATQALEIVERNTRAQSKLIADLLEVSRAITGKLRLQLGPVEMSMVIEAALDAVRPAAEVKAIHLSYSHEGSGLIAGDPHRLQQVLWNLLSNAIKFTPRDGSVQIRMERVDTSLRITVSDTGQGIDPDFLPFLFERFRQADSSSTRAHGGMGLGLAIVRHLIELHGGTVRARSEGEDRGTTFTVELPLMAVRLEESASQAEARRFAESLLPQAPKEVDLRGVHVVVVDDQIGARRLVAAVFEASGARVSAFASPLPALEFLERADNKVDVLVSDIGMPGEDGCAFIQRLREREIASRKSPLPALALSAFAHPKDVERALRAGFQEYMVKPAEPGELVKQVAALANR